MDDLKAHVEEHISYPATKEEITQACNNMSDLSDDEKNMVRNLPERTYSDSRDVESTLGMM